MALGWIECVRGPEIRAEKIIKPIIRIVFFAMKLSRNECRVYIFWEHNAVRDGREALMRMRKKDPNPFLPGVARSYPFAHGSQGRSADPGTDHDTQGPRERAEMDL